MVNKMLPDLKSEIRSGPDGGTHLEQGIPDLRAHFLRFGICLNVRPTYDAESSRYVYRTNNSTTEKKTAA